MLDDDAAELEPREVAACFVVVAGDVGDVGSLGLPQQALNHSFFRKAERSLSTERSQVPARNWATYG